jgi:hypothetical protein
MFEIGYSTALFSALGILYWVKSEDSDLKRGYIELPVTATGSSP